MEINTVMKRILSGLGCWLAIGISLYGVENLPLLMQRGKYGQVKSLVEAGDADLEATDSFNRTVLHWAALDNAELIPRAFFYFLEKFSPPQTGEFFESQKEEHFHFSKNSPGETGTSFCLKKSLNIAKMVEKRFELPTSTHDLSYEKIRLADCHKIPIFSDKSENPHARVTGVHKFLTFTPPSVPVDNREASHQEMKPL